MFGVFQFGEPYFAEGAPFLYDVEPPSFVSEVELEASYAPALTLTASNERALPAEAVYAPSATLRASVE